MMKRLIAICLVLLLFVSTASATGWEDGLGPSGPNPYQRGDIDLTTSIGYMVFAPNKIMSAVGGTRKLYIYLPRDDVKLYKGNLSLTSDDRGVEWRVDVSDTNYVSQRELVASELEGLAWGGGTCIEITLPVSLRLGHAYSVGMDAGCIVIDGTNIGSPAFSGNDHWYFETTSDFGVSELEYRHPKANGGYESGVINPVEGDEIRFDVVLGGEAKLAVLYVIRGAEFEVHNFTESCEVTGKVTGEDPYWGVIFLNENNEAIGRLEF